MHSNIDEADKKSIAKSLSETLSRELLVGLLKPKLFDINHQFYKNLCQPMHLNQVDTHQLC